MNEIVKPDRLRVLEQRAEHGVITRTEERELENLQSDFAAKLARLGEGEPIETEHGEYRPEQIDYGYHPQKLSTQEREAFHAIRGTKPSLWERFTNWLRTGGHR